MTEFNKETVLLSIFCQYSRPFADILIFVDGTVISAQDNDINIAVQKEQIICRTDQKWASIKVHLATVFILLR